MKSLTCSPFPLALCPDARQLGTDAKAHWSPSGGLMQRLRLAALERY